MKVREASRHRVESTTAQKKSSSWDGKLDGFAAPLSHGLQSKTTLGGYSNPNVDPAGNSTGKQGMQSTQPSSPIHEKNRDCGWTLRRTRKGSMHHVNGLFQMNSLPCEEMGGKRATVPLPHTSEDCDGNRESLHEYQFPPLGVKRSNPLSIRPGMQVT